jgi:NADH-quinone oxidoreductase subunit I
MTDVYEFSEYERENLVYDFVTLTQEEREQKKLNYEKFMAEKAAADAAAKQAPKEEPKKES